MLDQHSTPSDRAVTVGALNSAEAMGDTGENQAPHYADIKRAVAFLTEHWTHHPDLPALAEHMGMSPAYCQKLFKAWCGLSPKEFVQAITIDHAKHLLDQSASVLDAALEVGLSGPSRLHDLFVDHEAMTPGDYKRRSAGLTISYGFAHSPFGPALIMFTDRGICGLAFADDDAPPLAEQTAQHPLRDRAQTLQDMQRRWPRATYVHEEAGAAALARTIFRRPGSQPSAAPLRLVLIGSDFDLQVWETLLKIPPGKAVSYGDLARHLGKPGASRAIGTAVGRNPISFVVPCHRVLRTDGGLGGYHWGVTRKRAIIGWEHGVLQTAG